MTIDAIACEPQFLDHMAPVWRSLLDRGRFLVDAPLMDRARMRGVDAEPIDAQAIRVGSLLQPPRFDGMPAFVSSIGDIKVARRLGYGPFAFLEHGAGQSYDTTSAVKSSYAGGPDREDNELFMVPNEYSADRWRTAYPMARVEVVGSPRLDSLPARLPGPGPVVAISFHGKWPGNAVPYGGNALADYAARLGELAKRFTVIGHAHPRVGWLDELRRSYDRAGIEVVPEFDDVCRRADVYVCDNSSTIFEFASTGRPVVLLNAAHWQRKGGPGLRFWDAAHVGINVWPNDNLGDAIEEALARDGHAGGMKFSSMTYADRSFTDWDREDALSFVYPIRTGGAALAAGHLMDWAREAVAA